MTSNSQKLFYINLWSNKAER